MFTNVFQKKFFVERKQNAFKRKNADYYFWLPIVFAISMAVANLALKSRTPESLLFLFNLSFFEVQKFPSHLDTQCREWHTKCLITDMSISLLKLTRRL